ncbi:MAG: nitrite reductase large subunit NirB [Candidatus Binatia bacterium]|nr:nitrite reductase large subunit NirB [Candidatus Binatia bacterium]
MDRTTNSDVAPTRVVVVGHGMVAHRFCEKLAERDTTGQFLVTAVGEEPRPAYDRVHLSEFFGGKSAEDLGIADPDWYANTAYTLHVNERVESIDRNARSITTSAGRSVPYETLVLATGSSPFVPPLPGVETPGVFVYRTIEDLERIRAWADKSRRAAVIGGGLLGLEAAKAVVDMGLEAHIVEFADRLMPRQLDAAGAQILRTSIEALGVHVHTGARTRAIVGPGEVCALEFDDAPPLDVDMVIVSAGIRPRDELARACGVSVGERGGIQIDDGLTTSDPHIFAIGECALHSGMVYGLVGPGYTMADVLARRITGEDASFTGADLSTKLKLLGVEVASFGDAFADQARPLEVRSVSFEDKVRGVYQKLVVEGERLVGGILVGDAEPFATLARIAKEAGPIPERPHELLFGANGTATDTASALPDDAQICSCNDVTKGDLLQAIAADDLSTVAEVKTCTRAGTGCGGCIPSVTQVLENALSQSGREVSRNVCEHFAYSREELFWVVKLGRIETFYALLDSHGTGDGCEVCRPVVASILAATWNDLIVRHSTIQDTNDRFLANIQRGGTYSVIPRVPGGEITPDKLIVLGEVAKKYDLYCKITGGQRIDLLGARVDQLPDIWAQLVEAGFESGHAYGKAMRTVKSCIGSTWCRYGVQDSTAFAIEIEERYRGLRAPHKLKSAVSGCVRECAEAQNKDFGIIATENGWNVYLCGNGGSNPRHGDLFATDVTSAEVFRILDRFLMFYIQTAKPLQRTARWLEDLDGGIEYLRTVVLEDSLGIADQLEADMQKLIDSYECEWKAVVESPELRERFQHFADDRAPGEALPFVRERGQRRPAAWPAPTPIHRNGHVPPKKAWTWQRLGQVDQFPENGGAAVRYGNEQIAIYNFSRRAEWYATQATCPHRKDTVLARGLLGDHKGEPKVACPLHKKTFSLHTGDGLSDPSYQVRTFPVEIRGEAVWVQLPPAESLGAELGCPGRAA